MQAALTILGAVGKWVLGLLAVYFAGRSGARSDARGAISEVKDAQLVEGARPRDRDAVAGRMRDGTF
jgi:hypothetical protein